MTDEQKAKMADILKRMREKRERYEKAQLDPDPRYDDIYWEGVKWLNEQ